MAIDPYKNEREKKWRYLYTRADKIHRARQLGMEYPRKPVDDLLNEPPLNVLFVCTMNRWRSPTAEKVYADHPMLVARSRGTSRKARRSVSADDIKWADVVFVMEEKHQRQLRTWFPGETAYTDIRVLDIPDEYQFMDDELVQCIRETVDGLLTE